MMDQNIVQNIDLNEEYTMRDLDLNVEFNRGDIDLNVEFNGNQRDLDLNVDYNESDQNLSTGWLHPCENHGGVIIPDPLEVHASNGLNITDHTSDPSQIATHNGLNVSARYALPANIQPEQFQAGFGHATVGPVSGTQLSSEEARQMEIQRTIQLQMTAAYSQASVLHNMYSGGYMVNSQVHGQSPLPFQHDLLAFSNLAEYPVGEIVSGQAFAHVPVFHETPQGSQWSNIMSPGSVPAPFWPAYAGTGIDYVTDYHLPRRTTLGPQTGMGNSAHFAANISPRIADDHYVCLLLIAQALLYREALLHELSAAGPMQDETDNVSLAMSEEDILMQLRREIFQPTTGVTSGSDEFCCICQENYGHGDELGKIDCGHKYHFDCIKDWLLLRNSCPICKRKALAAGP